MLGEYFKLSYFFFFVIMYLFYGVIRRNQESTKNFIICSFKNLSFLEIFNFQFA